MPSLDEIKNLTASLLDEIDREEYVSNISTDSVKDMASAPYKDEDDIFMTSDKSTNTCNKYYGHDMRYDGSDYLFRAGNGCPGDGCGMSWWRLKKNYWNHEFLNRRCGNHNNLAQLKFTRR